MIRKVLPILTFAILLVIATAYANPVHMIDKYYPFIFLFYLILALALDEESRTPLIAGMLLLLVTSLFTFAEEAKAIMDRLTIYAFYFIGIGFIIELIDYVLRNLGVQRRKEKEPNS